MKQQKPKIISRVCQMFISSPKETMDKLKQMDEEQAKQILAAIKQGAEQGDEECQQAIASIQKVVKAAKQGTKLSCCPSGYSHVIFKKGGKLCGKCVKKSEEGTKVAKEACGGKSKKVSTAACGCKSKKVKKHSLGGYLYPFS